MRYSFLGCPIDALSMAETVEVARGAMRSRRRVQHVALNVAKLVNMRSDPVLAADVANSDVVGIDGMGIVWGARALGLPVTSRVAGVDLLGELLAICAWEGFKPFFLGARPEVLQGAAERVRELYPAIRFAGLRDGYFTREQEPEVVRAIRESGADCLFIGMPTPRKERFLAAHRDELATPFIMGVGGSFDVLAGAVQRAPERMQRFGLEWLYRVYQEPRRMWWRYARTNALYAGILTTALVRQGLGGAVGPGGFAPPAGRVGG
ncbi:WecB/TagA/CpsF family glycosyltransferase [Rhodoblastus acidophilus]|uniref:WecB/TagA/CpsF family glycosyltransferase n=1 Tax=Candidatus Rhodoblastus alkanivorans TaxID=2954117 RepID=A0ABS9Z9U5_9HYPH|nr:WecB/TagA/CpsF family glycosyltransferase [Candidatus Rhodoblastus alkanivorans]MCI4677056.1 WecB/TagA/CpsF family glycosyltransferase [Candidatus Rhodoblastus alkanivorans]MCI4684409.1 WecB/TagA/CpsF family glycosyltransferase [Candidatus Rhodoblastus alkanivorans]MDI4641730.1 WecB/TagA/CpsF family glycosyltransferase [Rhodoblastus acidophilus]